jgi:nitrogen fixation protein NifU and related proteins
MSVEDLYREIILDHYRSPRNKRRGVEGAVSVKHDNPLCGDELFLSVDVQDGSLSDVAFDGKGCSISQASASMMTEAVTGHSVEEALELAETIRLMMHGESPDGDLGDLMALEGVAKFPVRVKCALLAWMALKDVLGGPGASASRASGSPRDGQEAR